MPGSWDEILRLGLVLDVIFWRRTCVRGNFGLGSVTKTSPRFATRFGTPSERPPFKGDQSRSRILEEAGRWWFRKGSTVKKGMIAGKMGCTWNTKADGFSKMFFFLKFSAPQNLI